MNVLKQRYEGTRWTLVFGAYAGVEQVAIQKLNAMVQSHLPYVVKCIPASQFVPENEGHVILIGTPASNPWVEKLVRAGSVKLANHLQSFALAGMDAPWVAGRRLLVIAGRTEAGLLHGVAHFGTHLANPAITVERPTMVKRQKAFDSIKDFMIQEQPLIENRGLWTWGYVVYNYRRYLDNMARLKLNMVTIWNDYPPVNIKEIIAYAHARGIKIILGFPWGWGQQHDLAKAEDRKKIKELVFQDYEKNYAHLDIDGIYFQTLTEHAQTEVGGKSLAAVVCEMVNEIGTGLLAKYPGLNLQFGLHATSIRERYTDLAGLDPRIMIVWEDVGALPFSYLPETVYALAPEGLRTYEETLEYSLKLATFRKNSSFAMVPKGWACIDWPDEFEHHDQFLLGECDAGFIAERLAARQPHWDRMNALWLRNYPLAVRFYREILKCCPASITVTGLVEDGLFEERIQSSVALFAETIWNPEREPGDILELALSPAHTRP